LVTKYVGITGNEKAERAAKFALNPIPYTDLKPIIMSITNGNKTGTYKHKINFNKFIP